MRRALSSLCAATVVAGLLALAPAQSAQSAPDPDDAESTLRSDADGSVVVRKEGGVVTFAGASAGTEVDNPSVDRGDSVSAAARAHLQRYGPAFGTDRPGTTLVQERRSRAVTGAGVVRYQQHVGGLPVVGGDVVVVLSDGKDLSSVNANLSDVQSVPAAVVSEADARRTAISKVRRSTGGSPTAAAGERWLWDPSAIGRSDSTGPRGVWRFEVRGDTAVRHQVLVDDRTGDVLLDLDLIQHVDRVVCDQGNVSVVEPPACTSGFDRTEDPATVSAVNDVEQAFHNAGATAQFYDDVIGLDLTALIGLDTASGPKLASTVRICITGNPCPYDNAYWDGRQMFYGAGFAAADDVVGHEMTHGVIEQTSNLLYLDESGAINESLADIIGEIVDHRNVADGEGVTWTTGEDLTGGAFRDLSHPEVHGQPDRMTSPNWAVDPTYEDSGGVHTNSGVGNKAFFLISQGGSFNGQTIAGIDAGDPTLARSSALWLQVIETVTSYTDYADLAVVLKQSCAALVTAGDLSAADCTAVQQATLATEMAQRPTAEPFRDADRSCPDGLHKRVLLDAEAASSPAAKFTTDAGWVRLPVPSDPSPPLNGYSGDSSWHAADPATTATGSMVATNGIALPLDQPTYLAFRHWHVTDFDVTSTGTVRYWDGGTVDLLDANDSAYSLPADAWVNGPTRSLQTPYSGVKAFAGSSRGWVGSRVDLSSAAGQVIRPRFRMRSDESFGAPGWYVDDIELFTCDPVLTTTGTPVVSAGPRVGRVSSVTAPTLSHPDAVATYQWRRNGVAIPGASLRTYTPVAIDLGTRLSVTVTGRLGAQSKPVTSAVSAAVLPGILTPPAAVYTNGRPRVGYRLTASPGIWKPSGVTFRYRWLRDGKPITGATGRTYLLRRVDRGHRVSVRIAGVKAGYTTVVKRSPAVLVRR